MKKIEIGTPFYDGTTFDARTIRYFNITDGILTVIARNYDWSFVELTSVDWIDYGESDEGWHYHISTGAWTTIKQEDEPNWDALEGNQAEIIPEDYLKEVEEYERNVVSISRIKEIYADEDDD